MVLQILLKNYVNTIVIFATIRTEAMRWCIDVCLDTDVL